MPDSPGEGHLDDVRQRPKVRRDRAERARVVGTKEAVGDEEDAGVGLAQDVRRFVTLQPGIERHQPGPGRQRAEGGRDPRGGVGSPERHPVPGFDATGDQAPGDAEHLSLNVDKGHPPFAVHDGIAHTETHRLCAHHLRDRAVAEVGARVSVCVVLGQDVDTSGSLSQYDTRLTLFAPGAIVLGSRQQGLFGCALRPSECCGPSEPETESGGVRLLERATR